MIFENILNAYYYASLLAHLYGKYRKSYCSHLGVDVGVGVRVHIRVAQMLKFLIKVFRILYLLNTSMNQVDAIYVVR